MVEKRPALGRGLSALIPDAPAPARLPASACARSRHRSPRARTRSSRARTSTRRGSRSSRDRSAPNGIIQPIVVRKATTGYEIIAGERRWRAAQRAGLLKVPVVVRDVPDDRLLEVALIENIQREDLNPIEEAHAYRRLADEFHLTQEQIADAVGKDRSSVANTCACCGCRTRCARTSAPARCRWATPARCSASTRPRSCAGARRRRPAACRCARPKRSSRRRPHAAPRRARPRRRTCTRAPPKSGSASRSARASASCARARAGGSRSTSHRKTNCSGSTSSSTEGQ